jgi:tetratricopeptide (TPR) repeat protein
MPIATYLIPGRRAILLLVCLGVYSTCGAIVARAQTDEPKDGRYYESLARKAHQEKDYSTFLANMKRAVELRPNHPRLMFNLAAAYALTGSGSEALRWLGKMAEMGLVFSAEKDKDFDSVKGSPEFQTVLARVERNKLPVTNGTPAFTIHEKGFIPEGIAYDPASGTFYLGSVYKRKIVSLNQKGETKDFATEQDGLWSAPADVELQGRGKRHDRSVQV